MVNGKYMLNTIYVFGAMIAAECNWENTGYQEVFSLCDFLFSLGGEYHSTRL